MHRSNTNRERGYIALISVLLIAIMLTSVVILSNYDVLFAYRDAADRTSDSVADALVRGCIDVGARSVLRGDPVVTPRSVALNATTSCTIESVSSTSDRVYVTASAFDGGVFVRYRATISRTYPVYITAFDRI